MSRFGKLPVIVPQGVEVQPEGEFIVVKGPKGSLKRSLPRLISVKQEGNEITIEAKNGTKQAKALQGTTRAHVLNMVTGVEKGWAKELELVGSGYRAEVRGRDLVLTVGYSHPVTINAPEGVSFAVEKTKITVSGIDREVVGQTAALVRGVRKPEPYKGKGIKYVDEYIRRKAGKQAAKTA